MPLLSVPLSPQARQQRPYGAMHQRLTAKVYYKIGAAAGC